MTNEDISRHYDKMKEIFKDRLPNPVHEPLKFKHYVELYKRFHLNKGE